VVAKLVTLCTRGLRWISDGHALEILRGQTSPVLDLRFFDEDLRLFYKDHEHPIRRVRFDQTTVDIKIVALGY